MNDTYCIFPVSLTCFKPHLINSLNLYVAGLLYKCSSIWANQVLLKKINISIFIKFLSLNAMAELFKGNSEQIIIIKIKYSASHLTTQFFK